MVIKKLTDAITRDLPRLDKPYYKTADYPGLELWVYPSGVKTWRYQYRVKNKKHPARKKIGNYPTISVTAAVKRAREISEKIYAGVDPKEQEKVDLLKMQLGEAIRSYYQEELTTVNGHAATTIKGIKATLGPWILRDTYDKEILDRVSKCEDLQYKKLDAITAKQFKRLFDACSSKSPITANRLQEYLRKFWNDYVKAEDNPFILKKKKKNQERIYLDFLDQAELQRVMAKLVKKDERSGRLNYNFYTENSLNPVTCLLLALMITTGRRIDEARTLTWAQYKQGLKPRIELLKTKTSKKNQQLIFSLGDDAKDILNLIMKDRLNNPDSAFYYPTGDERNKYCFPSKTYGMKIGKVKHNSKHIVDPGKTWSKILRLAGVERHMKLHSTRHTFATNFWINTPDIKALAEALGTTEAIAMKYAKLVGETTVQGINKIKFFADEKPVLKQVN